MDFQLMATTFARIARKAAAATMKAVARIGEFMVIGVFLSDRTIQDRGRAMGRPVPQSPPLLWQRHQDLSPMTKM
ncbi:hypothetical protein [Mesorhizobium sp. B2-4-15]|uniref:hypothetical protein n=1 Tax=Mesorhizobium sp. B2-4-15 TaxID=2589934 RepID=UPI0015EE544C|nr:hypothetical protein [Mesorhizobium sp. B2-4-15]